MSVPDLNDINARIAEARRWDQQATLKLCLYQRRHIVTTWKDRQKREAVKRRKLGATS